MEKLIGHWCETYFGFDYDLYLDKGIVFKTKKAKYLVAALTLQCVKYIVQCLVTQEAARMLGDHFDHYSKPVPYWRLVYLLYHLCGLINTYYFSKNVSKANIQVVVKYLRHFFDHQYQRSVGLTTRDVIKLDRISVVVLHIRWYFGRSVILIAGVAELRAILQIYHLLSAESFFYHNH
ncbi:hypothetical protein HDE_14578 [Halotydeus destructor]|nr:hypothetical protein HDE_14578 [Halotydeus destructor]